MALPVPDDGLTDILRRLPLWSLAVARCVCNTCRFLIDDRALLRPRILPHSVYGVVINYIDHRRPHLFSRPRSSSSSATTGGEIDGNLSSVPSYRMNWHVMDHCDGLLLWDIDWGDRLCVCNPATQRWATLPRCSEATGFVAGEYLAFDSATSSHYEVFLIPALSEIQIPSPLVHHKVKSMAAAPFCLDELLASQDGGSWTMEEPSPPPPPSSMDEQELYRFMTRHEELHWLMEWPPSPYKIDVFSSRTGRWEERPFVREGETVTTMNDMKPWNHVFTVK
ncbi:hypothetical protein E2562_014518 [Oryza meyeriana var. granulata]|uniref:F-box domain-containing protein n=1 Tax=Oryza meyeriana var. granulata TaxID=110450 RepID=A0A6G1EL67_9ORYZ|nr:hypothetical protein E2562_014518 [Oryza meyeriana var. granulata]